MKILVTGGAGFIGSAVFVILSKILIMMFLMLIS